MAITITLSGCAAQLSNSFYPPIKLDENSNYKIALLRLEVYNSIPNVKKANNTLQVTINGIDTKIVIPIGTYEIGDISTYIAEKIKLKSNETLELDDLFSIKSNTNTLQTIIFSKFPVSFNVPNSLAPLLGFPKTTKLEANHSVTSPKLADINPVDVIRVECNLATGSFLNGESSHTIYEFTPDVPPGYKITEVPKNLIYLPLINTNLISEVYVKFVDQDRGLIDFRGERSSVVLAIQKDGA